MLATRSHSRWILLLAAAVLAASGAVACDDGESEPADTSQADTADGDTTSADTTEADTDPGEIDMVMDTVDPAVYAPIRAAFVYRDETTNDSANLYVIDNAEANRELRLSDLPPLTTGIDCRVGVCAVNGDLSWLTVVDGAGALRAAEVGGDLSVANADLNLVADSAEKITLAGDNLAYIDGGTAYYEDLSDGLNLPTEVGVLVADVGDGIQYTDGGFAVGPSGGAGLVYRLDRSSMAIFRVDLATATESYVGRFGVPGGTGSETDGNQPITVASDGSTAVMLYSGVHSYGFCRSNQDCGDIPQATCQYAINEFGERSEDGICVSLRRSLKKFSIAADSDLGQTCTSDDECDPRHTCLPIADTLTELTPTLVCTPREMILGGFGVNACSVNGTDEWPDFANKIRITADDRVVLLGVNECQTNTLNVPSTAVLAVSIDDIDGTTPIREAIQYLEGPYTQDHGQAFCYDTIEDRYNYDECTIEIRDFDLAPGGGLVLRGSGAAELNDNEIWMYDSAGKKFQVTKDIFNDAAESYAVSQ